MHNCVLTPRNLRAINPHIAVNVSPDTAKEETHPLYCDQRLSLCLQWLYIPNRVMDLLLDRVWFVFKYYEPISEMHNVFSVFYAEQVN